jgi:hypothetical protein
MVISLSVPSKEYSFSRVLLDQMMHQMMDIHVTVQLIHVPLASQEQVGDVLSELLQWTVAEARSLASLLYTQTHGNVYAMQVFLQWLVKKELLQWNSAKEHCHMGLPRYFGGFAFVQRQQQQQQQQQCGTGPAPMDSGASSDRHVDSIASGCLFERPTIPCNTCYGNPNTWQIFCNQPSNSGLLYPCFMTTATRTRRTVALRQHGPTPTTKSRTLSFAI